MIAQALAEGRNRGLITAREIANLRRRGKHAAWFDKLLTEREK